MYVNSNIEALIGFIVLQTCLCHDKLLEVITFLASKKSVLKTIVHLTGIVDAFLTH